MTFALSSDRFVDLSPNNVGSLLKVSTQYQNSVYVRACSFVYICVCVCGRVGVGMA